MTASSQVERRLNDPVTHHMRTDFARLYAHQTIDDALRSIRANPPEGRIIYLYVLDERGRIRGVVPTRRLLLNPPETLVADIMVRNVITIPARATVLEACEFFLLHRLLAFPVVNEQQELLGIVDVELYTDELSDLDRREGNDDLFQLIGVHLADAKQTSPVKAFRNRFPWLIANLAGGVLAAFLSGVFQAELQKAVSLALFIPVVLALSESVSIQSVSLALEFLRGKRPNLAAVMRRLRSEVATGLLLGLATGSAVALIALVWLGQAGVVMSVLCGIAGGVTCAAVIGVTVPNVLHLIRKDPQVAAGPVALALTDMITLLIYFSLARALLG